MLVLTRKRMESAVVGGSYRFQQILKVKVLAIQGEKVKLGFDVDPDVPVHRLEVWERIVRNARLDSPVHDAVGRVNQNPAIGTAHKDGAIDCNSKL